MSLRAERVPEFGSSVAGSDGVGASLGGGAGEAAGEERAEIEAERIFARWEWIAIEGHQRANERQSAAYAAIVLGDASSWETRAEQKVSSSSMEAVPMPSRVGLPSRGIRY